MQGENTEWGTKAVWRVLLLLADEKKNKNNLKNERNDPRNGTEPKIAVLRVLGTRELVVGMVRLTRGATRMFAGSDIRSSLRRSPSWLYTTNTSTFLLSLLSVPMILVQLEVSVKISAGRRRSEWEGLSQKAGYDTSFSWRRCCRLGRHIPLGLSSHPRQPARYSSTLNLWSSHTPTPFGFSSSASNL